MGNITRTKSAAAFAGLPKSSPRDPNIPLPMCRGRDGREPRPWSRDGTTVPGTSTCRATRLHPARTPHPPKTLRHRPSASHLDPNATSHSSNSDQAGTPADCCWDEPRNGDRLPRLAAGRQVVFAGCRSGSSPPDRPPDTTFGIASRATSSPAMRRPCSRTPNSRGSPQPCGDFVRASAVRFSSRSSRRRSSCRAASSRLSRSWPSICSRSRAIESPDLCERTTQSTRTITPFVRAPTRPLGTTLARPCSAPIPMPSTR